MDGWMDGWMDGIVHILHVGWDGIFHSHLFITVINPSG